MAEVPLEGEVPVLGVRRAGVFVHDDEGEGLGEGACGGAAGGGVGVLEVDGGSAELDEGGPGRELTGTWEAVPEPLAKGSKKMP